MDLRITITDENNDKLRVITIYQDGSDSEGATRITDFIQAQFESATWAQEYAEEHDND